MFASALVGPRVRGDISVCGERLTNGAPNKPQLSPRAWCGGVGCMFVAHSPHHRTLFLYGHGKIMASQTSSYQKKGKTNGAISAALSGVQSAGRYLVWWRAGRGGRRRALTINNV